MNKSETLVCLALHLCDKEEKEYFQVRKFFVLCQRVVTLKFV